MNLYIHISIYILSILLRFLGAVLTCTVTLSGPLPITHGAPSSAVRGLPAVSAGARRPHQSYASSLAIWLSETWFQVDSNLGGVHGSNIL